MKTLIPIKSICVVVLFFSLQPFTLFAQDSRIIENIWYLHDLVVDGTSNIPPVNNDIPFVPLYFFEDGTIGTGMCEQSGSGTVDYVGVDEFFVLYIAFLAGGCSDEDYSSLYQQFWSYFEESFFYEITDSEQIRTLVITNPNQDYAVYKNEIPLSINYFSASLFVFYPCPAQDVLNILHSFNEPLTATVYNLLGNKVLTSSIDNQSTSIEVSGLASGLYFMVFENETGQQVSKKFVKQ